MLTALQMPVEVNTTCHLDISPIKDELDPFIAINQHWIEPNNCNFQAYSEYFLGAPIATIERTFQATTQFAHSGWLTGHIFDTHKAPFPALNVHCHNEPVATDTIYADVPAIDNGSLVAQFFCGTESHFCDFYGIQMDGNFATILMDNIHKCGAMDLLISDHAQAEISNKVKDILCHLCIDDWQSEPHYHHQNAAEEAIDGSHMLQTKSSTPLVPLLIVGCCVSSMSALCRIDLLLNSLVGVLLLNALLAALPTSV